MKVPVWDFEIIVKSFLLDPILFGNPDNLVNSNAPFEKFIVDDPTESKEYLASRHYSQSYDLCIDDVDGPPRQLFFPFDIYLDVGEDGRNNILLWGARPHDHSATKARALCGRTHLLGVCWGSFQISRKLPRQKNGGTA
jgi:hypothetical protein